MKLWSNDGLLMSVSQEGGFRCDTVITEFFPPNINCYVCLTLELYYIYVLIYSLSLLLPLIEPLIDEKAQFIIDTGGMSVSLAYSQWQVWQVIGYAKWKFCF